ncbi:heterotrimeric G-protein alpha subunit, GPA2-like protein [Mycena capillaripes]|nr:heterotrimeric G-protein alpha subunit, GPA2-like protein [Mycena capillaripes]
MHDWVGLDCGPFPTGLQVTSQNRELHRQAEKALEEAKAKMASQVKVLLLDSGDSGKSAILKQMRLLHGIPFSAREIESYRQLVFDNLTRGLEHLLDALLDMGLELPPAYTHTDVELIERAPDICDGEPFPLEYLGALQRLWDEEVVRVAWARGNEIALPENLEYFFSDLLRLFHPAYVPTEQDILQTRKRTIGITETTFKLRYHEILMIDVDGQKSERRKWIHCFQDVKSILFVVSLSGYDQCLVEDRDANQMQDALNLWESICHSQWFEQTSIILLLTKNDIFEKKIKTSNIRAFFPDFDGEPGNAVQGRDYFKKRFGMLAQNGQAKSREIYIHTTTATDAELLRVCTAAIEE